VPEVTILADDLSGAADCGVQAARWGMHTVLRLAPPGGSVAAGSSDGALSWDLDTRSGDVARAVQRTAAAARSVGRDQRLYVKLDSSLRGHIGATLDAALDATGAPLALVAPAFPGQGRTTVDGRHSVRGVPAQELAGLLSAQSRNTVATLGLAAIRAGAARETLAALAGPGPWIVACDAEHHDDLERIARDLADPLRHAVWAGSAGLAAALAEVVAGPACPPPPAAFPIVDGPVLVVAGSTAPETLAQVGQLLAGGPVAFVSVAAAALAAGGRRAGAESERAAAALSSVLAAGGDAVLNVVGRAPDADRSRVAGVLGAIVRRACDPLAPGGLVLTGGETARAVCGALGIAELELLGEVEDGIPLALAHVTGLPGASPLPIITKAGAFGGPASLLCCCATLHGRTPCPVP
jgi:uncharacterized protein YgbK (DUF1537 family)